MELLIITHLQTLRGPLTQNKGRHPLMSGQAVT